MSYCADYERTFKVGDFQFRLFRRAGNPASAKVYRRLLNGDEPDPAQEEEEIKPELVKEMLPENLQGKYAVLCRGDNPAVD